jgi:hypothetical protein
VPTRPRRGGGRRDATDWILLAYFWNNSLFFSEEFVKTAIVYRLSTFPAAVGVSPHAVGADGSFADVAFSLPRRISAADMAMMLASMTLSIVNTDSRNECKQA